MRRRIPYRVCSCMPNGVVTHLEARRSNVAVECSHFLAEEGNEISEKVTNEPRFVTFFRNNV